MAFHEFVKSIMLAERRYYTDEASYIMNIFDCGAERNSSHFTNLRMLHALALRRGEATREGLGYVDVSKLVSMSEDVFDNREDVLRSLDRLVGRQLIEANTRSTDTVAGASHVRITSAGWYYSRFLVRAFSYLDLVMQDTPLNDAEVERRLRNMVQEVDNLGDREDQKLERMKVRFSRVRTFLEYLELEENREYWTFDLSHKGGIFNSSFVPVIREQVEREISWIERRLAENRELEVDDIPLGTDGLEVFESDSDLEEGTGLPASSAK